MERITFEGNFCDIAMCRENPCPYNGMCSQRQTWERLKEYEDSGLEPEEIKVREAAKYNAGYYHGDEDRCRWIEKELGPIDHLRDLLQAEYEGRLVVLPCKVGDTVHFVYEGNIHDVRVQGIHIGMHNKSILNFGGYPVQCTWGSEINKTVFLTREEAEAALKGGEG